MFSSPLCANPGTGPNCRGKQNKRAPRLTSKMQDGLISRAGAAICNDTYPAKGSANYNVPPVDGGAGQYSPSKACAHPHHHPARQPPSPQHTPCGDFKLCGYDGATMSCGPLGDECLPSSTGGSPLTGRTGKADLFGVLEFWLQLRYDLSTLPWEQLQTIQLKNPRAAPGCAYIPTKVCVCLFV